MNKRFVANVLLRLGIGYGIFRPNRPYRIKHYDLDHEWDFGLWWLLNHIEGERIVDGGCVSHIEFDNLLCQLGFWVWGVDIRQPRHPPSCGEFTLVNRSILDTGLVSSSFDTAIAQSFIEHVGLAHYNQDCVSGGDALAVAEYWRLLKVGGLLLMQVPYGSKYSVIGRNGHPFYRSYDVSTLKELVKTFLIEETVFALWDKGKWFSVAQAVANQITPDNAIPKCVVYLKCRKMEGLNADGPDSRRVRPTNLASGSGDLLAMVR